MPTPEWLRRLFTVERSTPQMPLEPGLTHFMQETDGEFTRFHLRVERDGSATLIANAAAAARLTPTGALIAKGLLEEVDEATILAQLKANFQGADETRMRNDIVRVATLIEEILSPADRYPIFNLSNEPFSPHAAELIAPLEATLPLAAPEQLVPLLDRLWEIGIPHAHFLVPETFEDTHLIRAIERAEDLGMIAGARGRATDLARDGLLEEIALAGIDHVSLPYATTDAALHDALFGEEDRAAADDLFARLEARQISAVAEVPLVETTLDDLEETIEHLLTLGADNFVFVAYATEEAKVDDGSFTADAMPQVATRVEEIAHSTQARFMWAPPVARDLTRTLAEQVRRGPRCTGDVAVRVEPDGRIIPPRGPYRSAGNVLTDAWKTIWNDEAFQVFREKVEAPQRCNVCPGLTICAAACPRDSEAWARPA